MVGRLVYHYSLPQRLLARHVIGDFADVRVADDFNANLAPHVFRNVEDIRVPDIRVADVQAEALHVQAEAAHEYEQRVHMFGISLRDFLMFVIPKMNREYFPLYDPSIQHSLNYEEIVDCIRNWDEDGGLKYFKTFPVDFEKEDALYRILCEGFERWHNMDCCAGMDISLRVLQEGMH